MIHAAVIIDENIVLFKCDSYYQFIDLSDMTGTWSTCNLYALLTTSHLTKLGSHEIKRYNELVHKYPNLFVRKIHG